MRSLVETDYAGNTNGGTLQVGNAACDPVRSHADGSKAMDACFGAEVVDLRLGGIELEEGVVDSARDRRRERVGGLVGITVDGGDGGLYDGSPFRVSIASSRSHCFGWVR